MTPTVAVARAGALAFAAYGTPTPQGSKKIVGHGQRPVLVDVGAARLRTWREDVKQAALDALAETTEWDRDVPGVVGSFIFTLKRPRAHHVAADPARELKESAPKFHTSTPDLDKLLRSTWDALVAAGVIRDDSLLCQVYGSKMFTDPTGQVALDRPGVTVLLTGVRP